LSTNKQHTLSIVADLAVNFFTTGLYVFACVCVFQALVEYVTALSDSV
jgi:hypothetical protein